MKFKGDIIITDPCYIVPNDTDWCKCNYGKNMEVLGIYNCISESTIYGDWGCTTYNIGDRNPFDVIKELEGGVYLPSYLKSIGKFCADAGMVGVFNLEEVAKYNPDIYIWIIKHPWCVTTIPDFEGEIKYMIDGDNNAHIVGIGDINFVTLQTCL